MTNLSVARAASRVEVRPFQHWGWAAHFPGDVGFDAFENVVDVYNFDWNLAIWWNTDLAEATRALHAHKQLGRLWDPLEEIRKALDAPDGLEVFLNIASRLPRTITRCAEQLGAAVQHVIKSNVDVRPTAWMLYDSTTGVWHQEGRDGVSAAVTDAVVRFAGALGLAIDAAEAMLAVVEPWPGEDPGTAVGAVNAQGYTLAQWEEATERRGAMRAALSEASKMARAIHRGAHASLRAELKSRVESTATAWDSDTRWLVLRDGVINVEDVARKGVVELQEFSPRHMSTMALDVAWTDEERNAGKSEWDRGVEKVLPDREVRVYLQKRFGAALLGRPGTAGKSMVWQYGVGDTAKSTLQECIAGARGVFAPYAVVVTSDALTERGVMKGAGDRFKAYARGKRFVLMSELTANELLDQGLVKSVTGGETVEGTAKYANAVSYFFTATLFMASNHPPAFPAGDTALVGRIHVVPFEHRLWVRSKNPKEWEEANPEHRADEEWATNVLASPQERAAILRWVLDGLVLFGTEGLGELPEAMQEAREDFAAEADPVGRLVRTLLGTEPSWEGSPLVKIYTDREWDASGWLERDGLSTGRLEFLINWRARELGLVKFGEDGLSPKWTKAAMRMLHELGGRKKKAKLDVDEGRTGVVYSRIREVTTGQVTAVPVTNEGAGTFRATDDDV